ncbi:MAG: right-handed parallel beta-helix repeat-containing protein, partial [Myxococcales bacterium]
CGAYICEPTGCLTACDDNSDCVAGLCDLRDGSCPLASAVTQLDCDANAEALQLAIDANCSAAPPCYLHVLAGTCNKITVQNKDIYIAGTVGAMIRPSNPGPAVLVLDILGENTRLALVDMTIQGASSDGVRCTGIDSDNKPEIAIIRSTIGLPGAGVNTGNGIHVTNCGLTIRESTIQNNSLTGINASASELTVRDSTIQNNSQAGIEASTTGVTVDKGIIQGNSATGLSIFNSSFDVANSIIALNDLFGVEIHATTSNLTKTFRHNTVARNIAGGMSCSGSTGATAIFRSLFWNPGGSELFGVCDADPTSDIPGLQDSCGNGTNEPGFVKPSPPDASFLLAPNSPCRNRISCDPQVTADIEGNPRPDGSTSMCEPGADELPP